MILIEIIYLLTGRTLLFLSSLLVRDKFLLINFVKFNRKKRGTLCELNEERGFASIISPFIVSRRRAHLFFHSNLTKLMRRNLTINSSKDEGEELASLTGRKEALSMNLRVKREMMGAKPLSSLSSRRTHLFFSSLLSIR